MPFDDKTAPIAGRIGGKRSAEKRWGGKDPSTVRSVLFSLKVTPEELDMINSKATAEGVSKTELVVRAVYRYTTCENNP